MVTVKQIVERKSRDLNRSRARDMRHSPVGTEKTVWFEIRNRKLGGYKFKRQYLIGPYIADYVCLEKKLIVELDGPLHNENYDAVRDRYLREHGYRVMRFKNSDTLDNLGIVLLMILHELNTPSPDPLPRRVRGLGGDVSG